MRFSRLFFRKLLYMKRQNMVFDYVQSKNVHQNFAVVPVKQRSARKATDQKNIFDLRNGSYIWFLLQMRKYLSDEEVFSWKKQIMDLGIENFENEKYMKRLDIKWMANLSLADPCQTCYSTKGVFQERAELSSWLVKHTRTLERFPGWFFFALIASRKKHKQVRFINTYINVLFLIWVFCPSISQEP